MLEQKLQQKLLQKLSPQQIQLIKLLELPTIQLEQRVKKELEENPVLEEGKDADEFNYEKEEQEDNEKENEYDDEFSIEDYIEEEEIPTYKLKVNNFSKDDTKYEIPYSEGMSLHEHLHNQLGLRAFDEKEEMLAKYLIGSIDESGYLRREIPAIIDDLAFTMNIISTEDELNYVLKEIQNFDPPGVGASSLQESLLLQVERKKDDENTTVYKVAHSILKDCFDLFSKKHYTKIIQRLNIDRDDLKDAVEIIIKLNPKPGSIYSGSLNKTSQHITPDFILELEDGLTTIRLNSRNVPDLKVSKTYADMLRTYNEKRKKASKNEKNTITFVKQKLDSAKWFIEAIKQRQNTLLLTMNAIIEYQNKYFKDGDETLLRPMILKDIAERTQLDISTISRVANSKYIQTHFGIYPLKYFFSEGMETQEGGQVSTREIKRILQECIDNEDKRKPLTDEKLAKILQTKGYRIARRTVAKYREQLNILVARLRKEI